MKRFLILALFFYSCNQSSESIPFASDKYLSCNSIVGESCPDREGDYCLFGFKWGDANDFYPRGIESSGPEIAGGVLTYSFHENAISVSNHRQEHVPALSFSSLPSCAREQITQAISDWGDVADISFHELSDDSEADIEIYAADVITGGSGFPRFVSSPCNELAGQMILSPTYTRNCRVFYRYVLHEFGHILGLGHSDPTNIMGTSLRNSTLDVLQAGDSLGLLEIYGPKRIE